MATVNTGTSAKSQLTAGIAPITTAAPRLWPTAPVLS